MATDQTLVEILRADNGFKTITSADGAQTGGPWRIQVLNDATFSVLTGRNCTTTNITSGSLTVPAGFIFPGIFTAVTVDLGAVNLLPCRPGTYDQN